MDITPLISKDENYITSYTSLGFRINQDMVEGSIILTPTILKPWALKSFKNIGIKDFDCLDKAKLPEIILLGTGVNFFSLPQAIISQLQKEEIFVEVMDTAAACRTYNILLSEGRNVLAMHVQAT